MKESFIGAKRHIVLTSFFFISLKLSDILFSILGLYTHLSHRQLLHHKSNTYVMRFHKSALCASVGARVCLCEGQMCLRENYSLFAIFLWLLFSSFRVIYIQYTCIRLETSTREKNFFYFIGFCTSCIQTYAPIYPDQSLNIKL